MTDAPPETTTVTVPRWALDYLLQHADCDDAGGHQSSEMIAARYHLDLAVEKKSETTADTIPIGAITREALVEALQTAWDDWCGDTGCFPECFTLYRGRIMADFRHSNFVTQVAAQLQLEVMKSMPETTATPAPPQTDREFAVWEHGRRQGVREGMRNQRPRLGYRIDTHGDAAVIVWNEGGCRPASREECEMWSYLASQCPAAEAPSD